jgi:hypothetical protein
MTLARKRPYGDITTGSEMEVMGYSKLQADSPPEAMIKETEGSFRSEQNQVDGHLVYGGGDHAVCERLLKFGIQESDVWLLIQRHLQAELTLVAVLYEN